MAQGRLPVTAFAPLHELQRRHAQRLRPETQWRQLHQLLQQPGLDALDVRRRLQRNAIALPLFQALLGRLYDPLAFFILLQQRPHPAHDAQAVCALGQAGQQARSGFAHFLAAISQQFLQQRLIVHRQTQRQRLHHGQALLGVEFFEAGLQPRSGLRRVIAALTAEQVHALLERAFLPDLFRIGRLFNAAGVTPLRIHCAQPAPALTEHRRQPAAQLDRLPTLVECQNQQTMRQALPGLI